MQEMKKLISVIAIVAMLTLTMHCVGAVSAAPTSHGPAGDGDGIPDGSQWGPGPAPSAGDCEPEGPEWPDFP